MIDYFLVTCFMFMSFVTIGLTLAAINKPIQGSCGGLNCSVSMTNNNTAITTSVDALNKTLEAPALDPVVLALANDYLSGKGVTELADEYGISEDRVTSVIEKRRSKIILILYLLLKDT